MESIGLPLAASYLRGKWWRGLAGTICGIASPRTRGQGSDTSARQTERPRGCGDRLTAGVLRGARRAFAGDQNLVQQRLDRMDGCVRVRSTISALLFESLRVR